MASSFLSSEIFYNYMNKWFLCLQAAVRSQWYLQWYLAIAIKRYSSVGSETDQIRILPEVRWWLKVSIWCVCPPCALVTARHLLYMESLKRFTDALGICAQTFMKAALSSAAFLGSRWIWFSRMWMSSHKCSIEFKSGLSEG
ncbi:hypothetical protein LOTGIDRAFT_165874 [Lottia gigantea]|uniref:Uncharacterized protein n=1 Tax=Lottia gigantea TaxID=225164 RepID=V3ZZN7_LOTGI|nr:hypothetical protein LOTGIDRAFT_165874 [Lottia gigantea]ESO88135.1 hypothetical protein LOTGIDRAFT_165874 [Lottia gigantea]